MFRAFSKVWLINILLAVFVVFFGMMSLDVWSKGDEPVQEIQTVKNPETPPPGKRIIERAMPPESTYGIVADKNLFSSSRVEFVPEKVEPGSGPLKISEKTVFLYGVVLTGDRKMALISNPEAGTPAGKKPVRDKWVKVGDTMGNFSVTDIRKDRIILSGGANTREILLYDKNKPARKKVVAAAEKPATPASGTTGPAVVTSATKSDKPQESTTAASAVTEGKGSAPAAEYKTINTPFGPVKRRIQ